MLASGQAIEIESAFNSGDLSGAMDRLKMARDKGLVDADPSLVTLGDKLEAAARQLARARKLENEGNCEQAIKTYKALLGSYPKLSDAQRGITSCKNELPPDISE
jgi:hypothetical protein